MEKIATPIFFKAQKNKSVIMEQQEHSVEFSESVGTPNEHGATSGLQHQVLGGRLLVSRHSSMLVGFFRPKH